MSRKWKFKAELIALCEKCTKLKPSTAKRYAGNFFAKWDDEVISYYSYKEIQSLRGKSNDLDKALNCLKSGVITWNSGALKMSEIESISFDERIEIKTKSGEKLNFNKEDFSYLEYVFKYSS